MNRYFGLHTLEGEWHALLPRYLLLSERVQGRRVLDIGCGSGIGASLLLELGAQLVDAIDHRPAVLELARMKHAKQGLDFHVMFWEELDFPDDTFDVVTCLDPSSPVTDQSLIQEVKRVLKPGGEYVCAVERKPIAGFEELLPRYGYSDSAESIDVHPHEARPPQLGELRASFERTAAVVQRPALAYVFDVDLPAEETIRKANEDGEEGVWRQESRGEGRWIASDGSLKRREPDDAAVEIWFCGPSDAPSPPLREIELPYYGLVERLRQVHNDLQMRQIRPNAEEAVFTDVIDSPQTMEYELPDSERERVPTNEFRVVSFEDDEPTGLRTRPRRALDPPAEDSGQLEAQLNELSALYQRVRHDFQNVVSDAQRALLERDQYIEHLVHQVHALQERFRADGGDDSLEEMTSAFEGESSRSSTPADEDEDAEASVDAGDASLEEESSESSLDEDSSDAGDLSEPSDSSAAEDDEEHDREEDDE